MHASLTAFTFGAEFEVLVPPQFTRHTAARELSRRAGLPVHSDMGGCPAGSWKVVSDMSVRGSGFNGLEFVSPILKGDDGLEQVRKIADALLAMGCTVNQTCGLHVHVGGHGGQLSFYKNLVKLYGRFEDVIDTFMPRSRRGNVATYCRSVKLGAAQIDNCTSAQDIANVLTRASRADAAKYHKVNLVPMGKPTVEFRHHAGTVDSRKAINWIIKCLRMVLAAREGRVGEGALMALEVAMLALKTRAVVEMCSQPNGATIREICERFGFSTVSVKRHARLAGVAFSQRGERFFITPMVPVAGGTAAPVTVQGLSQLLGETTEETEFFVSRVHALADAELANAGMTR
jgi:hypothetical protein